MSWGLRTRQPLWVTLCHFLEKGRKRRGSKGDEREGQGRKSIRNESEETERKGEKDRRDSKDEREGQGRSNGNENEETEEIKTFPLYPYLLKG